MGRSRRYERLMSAGGVVYRMQDGVMEVLLCGRRQPPLWCLPKGTPNAGEKVRETALREVEEETGVKPEIVSKLGSIRYYFTRVQDNTLCDKTVHHFLMRPVGGSLDLHDHEFDEVHWFPVDEAMRIMSYPNEVAMLRKAIKAVQHGTAAGDGRNGISPSPEAIESVEGDGGSTTGSRRRV